MYRDRKRVIKKRATTAGIRRIEYTVYIYKRFSVCQGYRKDRTAAVGLTTGVAKTKANGPISHGRDPAHCFLPPLYIYTLLLCSGSLSLYSHKQCDPLSSECD